MSQLFQGLLSVTRFGETPVVDENFDAANIRLSCYNFFDLKLPPNSASQGTVTPQSGGFVRVQNPDVVTQGKFSIEEQTEAGKWYEYTVSNVGNLTLFQNFTSVQFGSIGINQTVNSGTTDSLTPMVGGSPVYIEVWTNDLIALSFVDADNMVFEEVPALEGWTTGDGGDLSIVNQELMLTKGSGSFDGLGIYEFSVEPGENYVYQITRTGGNTATSSVGVSTTTATAGYITSQVVSDGDTAILSFNSPATPLYNIVTTGSTVGDTASYDNLRVRKVLNENSTFDTDTVWTKGTGWTIAGGFATAVAGTASDLEQSQTVNASAVYIVEVYVSNYGGGTVTPKIGTATGQAIFSNGLFTQKITALADGPQLVGLSKDDAFVGDIDYCIFSLDSYMEGFGGIKFKESSVGAPVYQDRGLPFDDSFVLSVDATNPISYYHQGLPFTVLGRIAVNLVGPVVRVAPGNVPFAADDRVVFSAGPGAVTANGVIYDANQAIVGIPI